MGIYQKKGTGTNLSDPTSWNVLSAGAQSYPSTNADKLQFDNISTSVLSNKLSFSSLPATVGSLSIESNLTASTVWIEAVTISSASTSITLSPTASIFRISNLTLSGSSQTWNLQKNYLTDYSTSQYGLYLDGILTGSTNITKTGNATAYIIAANPDYSGNFSVTDGLLYLGNSSSAGNTTQISVSGSGQVRLQATPGVPYKNYNNWVLTTDTQRLIFSGLYEIAGSITINDSGNVGTPGAFLFQYASNVCTIAGTITLNGNIIFQSTVSSTFNVTGNIGGTKGIQLISSNTLIVKLAGSNTYSGGTQVVNGKIIFNSAPPSTGSIFLGGDQNGDNNYGCLELSGHYSDPIKAVSGVNAVSTLSAGALLFSSNSSTSLNLSSYPSLFLGSSNADFTYSGTITPHSTSGYLFGTPKEIGYMLTVATNLSGSYPLTSLKGKTKLTGTNSYTGNNTIKNGSTLIVDNPQALGSSGFSNVSLGASNGFIENGNNLTVTSKITGPLGTTSLIKLNKLILKSDRNSQISIQ